MNTWNVKAHDLIRAQAQIVATILLDLHPDDPRTLQDAKHIASPAGSERALRGIPVVGAPGIGGTIAGTSPLQALIAKQPND